MKTKSPFQPLTYLACPYSHKSSVVRQLRFHAATVASAWWMAQHPKSNVFSPITHSHPLHEFAGMRGDWKFWKRIDTEYLRISKRLVVLMMAGWAKSVGVQAEIKIAKRLKIPIVYLYPSECGNIFNPWV